MVLITITNNTITTASIRGLIQMDRSDVQSEPLRILSLNGGGIRAISYLYSLNRVMKAVAIQRETPNEDLKPCDYFQLIGGTSAGGIIAIMLGSLEMTVPECLVTFEKLIVKVFKKGKKPFFRMFDRFKCSALVDAAEEVLKERGIPLDELLFDPSINRGCRTFVTTLARNRVTGNKEATLLRTYCAPVLQPESGPKCTIVQAIRATSAAPTVFKPVKIGETEFIDAALGGFNDPALMLEKEAKEIWPDRKIELFLSLATGIPTPLEYDDGIWIRRIFMLGKILKTGATNGETFLGNLEKRFDPGVFFRLNVGGGLGDISITDCRQLDHLKKCTNDYLEQREIKSTIEDLALKINGGHFYSLYDFGSENKYEYIEQHLPTTYKQIRRGMESVSQAKRYLKQKHLHIQGGRTVQANACERKRSYHLRLAHDQLFKALEPTLIEEFWRTRDSRLYQEATDLKRAWTAIRTEVKPQSRAVEMNLHCAEILRGVESRNHSINPNPIAVPSGI